MHVEVDAPIVAVGSLFVRPVVIKIPEPGGDIPTTRLASRPRSVCPQRFRDVDRLGIGQALCTRAANENLVVDVLADHRRRARRRRKRGSLRRVASG